MKKYLVLFATLLTNFVVCRDFYVGMFKTNDILVAQDRLYKESAPHTRQYAYYGRHFTCAITYFRVVDRLGYGRGPGVKVIRGGLRHKHIVLRLRSEYDLPISVNIYVGCENTMRSTLRSIHTTLQKEDKNTNDSIAKPENSTTTGQNGTTKPDDGGKKPEDDKKPTEDNNKQPEGDNKPPEGENKPPEGDNKPPEGDNKPPEGDNKPPEGDNKPPEGDNKPPEDDKPPGRRHRQIKKGKQVLHNTNTALRDYRDQHEPRKITPVLRKDSFYKKHKPSRKAANRRAKV